MKQNNMDHMNYIERVRDSDVATLHMKETTYQGSWKAAGGRSAWFMARRNMDRLMSMMSPPNTAQEIQQIFTDNIHGASESGGEVFITTEELLTLRSAYIAEDIFAKIEEHPEGEDGTVLACVRDLRCYLTLVEAEMMARGVVQRPQTERPTAAEPVRSALGGMYDELSEEFTIPREAVKKRFLEWLYGAAQPGGTIPFVDVVKSNLFAQPPPVVTNTPRAGESAEQSRARTREARDESHDRLVPRTSEDGGQHASLFPWQISGVEYERIMARGDEAARLVQLFYAQITPSIFRLEPYLPHPVEMLREINHCYKTTSTNDRLLLIKNVPPDLRVSYPDLAVELNHHEHKQLPIWQQHLYHMEETEKWVLKDAAWHIGE
jgi:hypothetical protein